MAFQMRREGREAVDRQAWLDAGDGSPLVVCTLVDISGSGAKLALDEVNRIPETFKLWLSRYGHPKYACRIVWRRTGAIGVKFELG
jgi:PilZ domain